MLVPSLAYRALPLLTVNDMAVALQVVASVAAKELAPGLTATLTGTIPDVSSAKVWTADVCTRVLCMAPTDRLQPCSWAWTMCCPT